MAPGTTTRRLVAQSIVDQAGGTQGITRSARSDWWSRHHRPDRSICWGRTDPGAGAGCAGRDRCRSEIGVRRRAPAADHQPGRAPARPSRASGKRRRRGQGRSWAGLFAESSGCAWDRSRRGRLCIVLAGGQGSRLGRPSAGLKRSLLGGNYRLIDGSPTRCDRRLGAAAAADARSPGRWAAVGPGSDPRRVSTRHVRRPRPQRFCQRECRCLLMASTRTPCWSVQRGHLFKLDGMSSAATWSATPAGQRPDAVSAGGQPRRDARGDYKPQPRGRTRSSPTVRIGALCVNCATLGDYGERRPPADGGSGEGLEFNIRVDRISTASCSCSPNRRLLMDLTRGGR